MADAPSFSELQAAFLQFGDEGGLCEIHALETDIHLWRRFLTSLTQEPWPVTFHRHREPLESVAEVLAGFESELSHLVSVDIGGALLHGHLFERWQIEFDLDPRELNESNFSALLHFMRLLSGSTERNAFLSDGGGVVGGIYCFDRVHQTFRRLTRPREQTSVGRNLHKQLVLIRTCRGIDVIVRAVDQLYTPDRVAWHLELTRPEYLAVDELGRWASGWTPGSVSDAWANELNERLDRAILTFSSGDAL